MFVVCANNQIMQHLEPMHADSGLVVATGSRQISKTKNLESTRTQTSSWRDMGRVVLRVSWLTACRYALIVLLLEGVVVGTNPEQTQSSPAHVPGLAVLGRGHREPSAVLVPAQAKLPAESRLFLRGGACFSRVSDEISEDEEPSDDPPSRVDWKRRILVTGGCGFMGSYLVDRLVSRYEDYLIVVLDVLDECGSLEHLRGALLQPNCVFVQGDIRDEHVVSDILTEHSIDTVLHLAAQTSVDHSFKDPSVFTQVCLSLFSCSQSLSPLPPLSPSQMDVSRPLL